MFSHEKLDGLDRERVLDAIIPILRAHRVRGVELEWKTDSHGWLLLLTVEAAGSEDAPPPNGPAGAVNVEVCAELSRDISAALDVASCIAPPYRLEVGSPGIERALYTPQDYQRFQGQLASLSLERPVRDQYAVTGRLVPASDERQVGLETEQGVVDVEFENIKRGRLVYEFGRVNTRPARNAAKRKRAQ